METEWFVDSIANDVKYSVKLFIKTIMIIAIISLSIPSYVGGVDGDYVRGIAWGCSSKDEQMTVNHWVWVRFPSSPLIYNYYNQV